MKSLRERSKILHSETKKKSHTWEHRWVRQDKNPQHTGHGNTLHPSQHQFVLFISPVTQKSSDAKRIQSFVQRLLETYSIWKSLAYVLQNISYVLQRISRIFLLFSFLLYVCWNWWYNQQGRQNEQGDHVLCKHGYSV